MDNLHYDLMKLALCKANTIWRIEKHYMADVTEDKKVEKLFLEMLKTDRKHLAELKKLLGKHLS
jgi:hypothetical protein